MEAKYAVSLWEAGSEGGEGDCSAIYCKVDSSMPVVVNSMVYAPWGVSITINRVLCHTRMGPIVRKPHLNSHNFAVPSNR